MIYFFVFLMIKAAVFVMDGQTAPKFRIIVMYHDISKLA